MEHVTPIQISAVTRGGHDGYDAILRLTVQDPGVPAVDVRVGNGYPDAMQAIAAVIAYAAQRLRPQTIPGQDAHPVRTTGVTPEPVTSGSTPGHLR